MGVCVKSGEGAGGGVGGGWMAGGWVGVVEEGWGGGGGCRGLGGTKTG